MTYTEAGQILGISVRTAKRWVSQSLRQLATRLGDLGPDDTPTESA